MLTLDVPPHRRRLLALGAALAALAAGCGPGAGAPPASGGATSPARAPLALAAADVPAGYVPTPAGALHASCVHEIPSGATLGADGAVRQGDRVVAQLPACAYPAARGPKLGLDRRSAGIPPPDLNGWVETATGYAGGGAKYFNYDSGSFVVPSSPTSFGQILYFFTGVYSTIGGYILQPVLSFGWPNSHGWALAVWYVQGSGSGGVHSTPIPVSPGDVISTRTMANGATTFLVQAWDATNGTQTNATYDVGAGNALPDVAAGAVLEAYYVSSCSQLPADGRMTFQSIQASTTVPPYWNALSPYAGFVAGVSDWVTTPPCGYGATLSGSGTGLAATLSYALTCTAGVPVTFQVTATTRPGQSVYVAGNQPALGSWNPASAFKLAYGGTGTATAPWSGTVRLPAYTDIQYKYVLYDPSQPISSTNPVWEANQPTASGNRQATTATCGRATTLDDGAF